MSKLWCVVLLIALATTIFVASGLIRNYEEIIESQAETIRILQAQVIELRSRLFEFRAVMGGVG